MKLSLPNPAAALFGPIFQKEVRASGRRKGTYILRFLYTLGLLGIAGFAFAGIRGVERQLGTVQRLQEMQKLAPMLTSAIMWFQVIAIAFIAPMLASPVICDERRARSLSTLLTTPLSSAQIVLGKISSRLVQLVILTLLAAPLLLAMRIFGGVDAWIIVAFTAVALTIGALGAALGLMYSIWHRRSTSAAFFALLTLVLVQAGPSTAEAILVYLLNEAFPSLGPYRFHEQVLATASPYALMGVTQSIMTGEAPPSFSIYWPWLYERLQTSAGTNPVGRVTLAPVWVFASLYNLLCAGLVSLGSIRALRTMMRKDAGEAAAASPRRTSRRNRKARKLAAALAQHGGPAEPDAAGESEELIFSTAAEEPTRDRKGASRIVSDSPVLWRELRRGGIRSRVMRRIVLILPIVGLLILYWAAGFDEPALHQTLAVVAALIVMLQAVFMTTGSISAEREGRTWEVLLTTPLTGREIIMGKFWGALRSQWYLPTLLLIHFMVFAIAVEIPWYMPFQLLFILLGPMLFFAATGQYLSLAFRKGVTSGVCNLMIGLTIWVALWMLLGLIVWFGDWMESDGAEAIWQVPWALNPAMMAGSASEVADQFPLRSRMVRYDMADTQLKFWAFNFWILAVFSVYGLAAAAVLAATIGRFRRLSGRTS